jgi:hypothetical protein
MRRDDDWPCRHLVAVLHQAVQVLARDVGLRDSPAAAAAAAVHVKTVQGVCTSGTLLVYRHVAHHEPASIMHACIKLDHEA